MEKTSWGKVSIEFSILFVGFYIVLFFLTHFCFLIIAGHPMDTNKRVSGAIFGFLVSSIPFLFMGYRLNQMYNCEVHKVLCGVIVICTLLEKVIPLILAYLVIMIDPFIASSPFFLLSEEFPNFAYRYYYLTFSIVLSILFLALKHF